MRMHFGAPWGLKLKLSTALILLLVALAYREADPPAAHAILALVLLCSAFAVRGYSIMDGELLIHRLGWASRYDLSQLRSAEHIPGATLGSVRTFGIGGLFGFIGSFHNPVLGTYRAYATDAKNAVVLDFGETKVVVTPALPADFVAVLRTGPAA